MIVPAITGLTHGRVAIWSDEPNCTWEASRSIGGSFQVVVGSSRTLSTLPCYAVSSRCTNRSTGQLTLNSKVAIDANRGLALQERRTSSRSNGYCCWASDACIKADSPHSSLVSVFRASQAHDGCIVRLIASWTAQGTHSGS